MRLIDLTGQRFGKLTVINRNIDKTDKVYWNCKCDCGNITIVDSRYLRTGHTKSCGCLKREKAKEVGLNNKQNLTNKLFGYLQVLEDSGKRQQTEIIWKCQCICGKITYVATSDLTHSKIQSCGCKQQVLNQKTRSDKMIGKKFGKLTVLSLNDSCNNDGSYNYNCQCECGNIKIVNGVSLRQGVTTSCGCINYSIGEQNIKKILDINNINYIKEYSIPELNYKRFDFAIINNNSQPTRFIEFDGRQHYESSNSLWEQSCSFEKRQIYDREKNEYAISHNIPLVRIPYYMRDKITLEMLLGNTYLVIPDN